MKLTLIILLTAVLFMSADKRDNFNRIRTTTESGSLKKEVSHRSLKKQPLHNAILIQGKIGLQDSVKLNTFTKLPNDVEGCVCYFYLSRLDEIKRKYIMSEAFAQIAYVSINGKMQRFNLVDFKDKVFYIYSNGNYTLRVEFKVNIRNDAENFKVIGVLKIFKAQKLLIKK